MQEALEDLETVLIAGSLENLQLMVDEVVDVTGNNGLYLNIKKTQFIVIIKKQQRQEVLWIHENQNEKVWTYKYLESVINETNEYEEEFKARLRKVISLPGTCRERQTLQLTSGYNAEKIKGYKSRNGLAI